MSTEEYAVVVPIPAILFDQYGFVAELHLSEARKIAHAKLTEDAERHGFTLQGSIKGDVLTPERADEVGIWGALAGDAWPEMGAYRVLVKVEVP